MKMNALHITVIAALIILLPFAANAQQSRNDFCMAGANALLRQHIDATAAARGHIATQCLCNLDADALKGYMNWCMTRASDQDLQALGQQISTSPCTDPNSPAMQHCVP